MAYSEKINIEVGNELMAGTLMSPERKVPGVLFVHGWGGSQQRDLARAKGIAGFGCVCLTFDMRGHEQTAASRQSVSREDSLADLLAAYDRLVSLPTIDSDKIAVIGTSYGGYLSAILSELRAVRWLALRVPALYWDEEWSSPKQLLDRERLAQYRRTVVTPLENRALTACSRFTGDVLLVESEFDDYIPHATLMNYRSSFEKAHSLTHRIMTGADHALTQDSDQKAYTSILTSWISEMIVESRTAEYPYYSAYYS
ncbi:alpha/beta hydrolase [Pseudomonas daroniae]|uniref:Alpha/beta hydrolase n=1 Tax=Phytopseudomonas daroniae TaxID=2487519 RepID=A0A4Q9QM81_9GAMM|nr:MULTISPECIES: alpha/beta hydrolase [Pseudomonas]TBU77872.1 alpha/beta hydrolase [Pseudomonas daroniae]TBU82219.1 alpha/beta hydrolase [Pseudomonas sp. FRB 228]TBU91153.1 alpha/beta hydrolase [Pseudomonas daroniae]